MSLHSNRIPKTMADLNVTNFMDNKDPKAEQCKKNNSDLIRAKA